MSVRTALLFLTIFVGGCAAHGEPATAKQVTLAELEQATADLERFSYLGTDPQFHYFKTPAGAYYKLPEPTWRPANREEMIHVISGVADLPAPDAPGFEQYVKVQQGQIVLAPLP